MNASTPPSLTAAAYADILSPYAQRAETSRGRTHPESDHSYRNPFQRDRDRIVHSRAFRRLEGKTQVLVNPLGDHHRTRLTHSLEVAQVSRTIARALHLHEDLVEAIALAHDLGHPPFGHAGEKVLNQLLKKEGGFEHNLQALRIVTTLENKYPDFSGLNLTYEVRRGLLKRPVRPPMTHMLDSPYDMSLQPVLEAQVVDLADAITYCYHDLEDGMTYGFFTLSTLTELSFWDEIDPTPRMSESPASNEILLYHLGRSLLNLFVGNVIEQTQNKLQTSQATHQQELLQSHHSVVTLSEKMRSRLHELRQFLFNHFYTHPDVLVMTHRAEHIMNALFHHISAHPEGLPDPTREKYQSAPNPRVIGDYLAGMTDHFAVEMAQKHRLVGL